MKPVLIPPSPDTQASSPSANASSHDIILWLQEKIISGKNEVTPSDINLFTQAVDGLLNQENNDTSVSFYINAGKLFFVLILKP